MTVFELIKAFFSGYKDCKVTVWIDGERYFIDSIDFSLAGEGIVELNIKSEEKHG